THRAADAAATLLTAEVADPAGYGRVVRGKEDKVKQIVEELDLTGEDRALITEINTSIYCFRRNVLAPSLRRISPDNAKGEYYLTDVVEVLYDAGYPVVAMAIEDPMEAAGVNDRAQLAVAEAELRDRTNERWMRRGVTMLDPERTYIDASVELGTDVTIFPGTLLQGETRIGDHAEIGPDARLVDCIVGDGAVIEQTVARQATIGDRARVGPFAVLQPGATIAADAVLEPFQMIPGADT
nr:bifunctional UDP-N-acetylglucosamine diphosphorylase/glucosamine-1-phosphate N-acetyltransferase GlmU [Actinomycetota bacterium]